MAKLPFHLVRNSIDVIANKTLTAADQGIVQNVVVDGVVITLPSTAAGLVFVISNGGDSPAGTPIGDGADFSCGFTIAPAAADAIAGLNLTAQANKGMINTKATSRVGDEVTLIGSGTAGVTAWQIAECFGTWARVA